MSTVTVGLEKKDEMHSFIKVYVNGMAPLIIGSKVRYQRLRFNAGVVATKDWDARAGRLSSAFSRRDGGNLQREIDLKMLCVGRAYHEVDVKTPEAVRERYLELLGRKRRVVRKSTLLLDIVRGWIAKADKAPHTVRTYVVFSRKVEDHEIRHGQKLDLISASTEDLNAFLTWCMNKYRLADNTMASAQKLVNMALNEMRAADIKVCGNVKRYSFRPPEKQVLEWEELAQVLAYQPEDRTEATAQTLLVALCLSGARISDTYRLLESICIRNGVLCAAFTCRKNEARHPVSVSPIVFEPVRQLIERNGVPDKISEKHIRTSLKRLLASAGVQKSIEVHSLRRSFVSLFLGLGVVPDHLLARCFTGHAIGGGARSIFHSYNRATMASAHRTVIQLLRLVPESQTGGLKLLSDEVSRL